MRLAKRCSLAVKGFFPLDKSSKVEEYIRFHLVRATGNEPEPFLCMELDVYEKSADGSQGVVQSKKLARVKFSKPINVNLEDYFSKADVTLEKWSIFDLTKQKAPPFSTSANVSENVQGKYQRLAFVIDQKKFPLSVRKGLLACGQNIYQGKGALDMKIPDMKITGTLASYFTVPYGETCTSLKLTILKYDNLESKQKTASDSPIAMDIEVQFDQPLKMLNSEKTMVKAFEPPACLLEATPLKTQGEIDPR